jgi:hypothetical protein
MSVHHIAVNSMIREDCEEIHRTYEIKRRVGYGDVHQVCKKNTMF